MFKNIRRYQCHGKHQLPLVAPRNRCAQEEEFAEKGIVGKRKGLSKLKENQGTFLELPMYFMQCSEKSIQKTREIFFMHASNWWNVGLPQNVKKGKSKSTKLHTQ